VHEPFESGPTAPVAVSISDAPIAPVALSFDSGPPESERATVPSRRGAGASSRGRRLIGWAIDLPLLLALVAAHVFLAVTILDVRGGWLEVALAAPSLWLAAGALLAVAWSWIFVALWGRTPGMALTGQRLRTLRGAAPGPAVAFVRALLAVACSAPGLFGFLLALFDRRGQTLQDKLCGCVVVVD